MREIDLYNQGDTNIDLLSGLNKLRQDFDSHQHDNVNSKSFETLRLESLLARTISIRKASYTDNNAGLWVGLVANTPKLFLGDGTNYLKWDGSALSIAGSLSATAGTIGGFSISSTTIKDSANSFGMTSAVTAGDDVRFWAGATEANRATAPFRVYESGIVVATGPTTVEIQTGTIFETAARFQQATGASGTISFNNQGVQIASSNNQTDYARLRWLGAPDIIGQSAIFSITFSVVDINAGGEAFFGLGFPTVSGSGHTFSERHIGFKIVSSTLYATQANGSTDASSSLVSASVNDKFELIIKINGSSSIDYYYRKNGGALVGPTNLSSAMPTLSTDIVQMDTSNGGVAAANTYQLYSTSFKR